MKKWLLLPGLLLLYNSVVAQQNKNWSWLIPSHAKIQYAGSIGFIAAGFGYESGNKRIQYDLFYGYVPKSAGGTEIHSFTGKLTWLIVCHQPKNDTRLDLFSAGLLVNYAFGDRYFLFNPENYPYRYYGFPTALHSAIFIGGGASKNKIGVYYELGTTSKDLLSYIGNSSTLSFVEILNVGIGIRLSIR